MNDRPRLGFSRHLLPVPGPLWEGEVAKNAQRNAARLAFMTPEHHLVRNFTVTELPRLGVPLMPDYIARRLDLPVDRVCLLLAELEKNLTFLYRNAEGAVVWAYPVTAERTPHRATFSSGEQIYAA